MSKATVLVSCLMALFCVVQLGVPAGAVVAQEGSANQEDSPRSPEKIVAALAKIARDTQDDETVRVSAMESMVEVFRSTGDENVESQVVDALIAVLENRDETSKIRSAAIYGLLEIVNERNR